MNSKKDIRPIILQAGINEGTSKAEEFQNIVLRPILKMQNELFLAVVNSHLDKKRISLHGMPMLKKEQTLRKTLTSDNLLKNELRGMVIGQMELSEFKAYLLIQPEAKKRIATMLEERIVDGLVGVCL